MDCITTIVKEKDFSLCYLAQTIHRPTNFPVQCLVSGFPYRLTGHSSSTSGNLQTNHWLRKL